MNRTGHVKAIIAAKIRRNAACLMAGSASPSFGIQTLWSDIMVTTSLKKSNVVKSAIMAHRNLTHNMDFKLFYLLIKSICCKKPNGFLQ